MRLRLLGLLEFDADNIAVGGPASDDRCYRDRQRAGCCKDLTKDEADNVRCKPKSSGQSYKGSTIVNYDSRVIPDLKIPHITTLGS